ncbi:MAG TPA: hypothetical protein VFD88_12445 [Clostridia bacterium]|nr:hypothetical protein [Clostridia bacterium]
MVIVHELTHILTDEWADAMQQVIRDMVPKKLQREARGLAMRLQQPKSQQSFLTDPQRG